MMTTKTVELRLPVSGYRALPIPGHEFNGKPTRLGHCFVKASDVPAELAEWMDVNPRKPQVKASKKSEQPKLTQQVARKIVKTLQTDPGQMAIRNQGIYLIVDEAEASKTQGGAEELRVALSKPDFHGLVNGGHTFFAVRQVYHGDETPPEEDAWIRFHVLQNVDPDNIVELADGLNRSFQVKERDLANLGDYFEPIKQAMSNHRGEEEIAYAQGDDGDVEIEEVLIRLSMLNLSWYADEKKQPNGMFAAKTGVINKYKDEFDIVNGQGAAKPILKEESGFRRLIPASHQILSVWDEIYGRLSQSEQPYFGLLGKSAGKPGKQAPKKRPAIFAEGVEISRRLTGDGLAYPIFAAMRANVDPAAWADGEFRWRAPVEAVLDANLEDMCRIVREEYERTGQPRKPAEVGKKPSAYRQCYQEVALFLLKREFEARA